MTKQEKLDVRAIQLGEVEKVTVKYRGVFEKAFTGLVRPAAVKAKCLQCVGYNRADVRDCEKSICPLWQYRPYRTPEQKKECLEIGTLTVAPKKSVVIGRPESDRPAQVAPAGEKRRTLMIVRRAP